AESAKAFPMQNSRQPWRSLFSFTSHRTVGAEKLRFSWTRCDCICRYPITREFDCHSPRKALQRTLSGSVACSEWQSSRDEARNIDDAAESPPDAWQAGELGLVEALVPRSPSLIRRTSAVQRFRSARVL